MNEEVVGPQNEVGIKDEIGQEITERQLAAVRRELDHFTKTLAEKEEDLKRAEEAQKVNLDVYGIVLEGDNLRKRTPEFRYEELDTYWELRHRQEEIQRDSFLRKSNAAIATVKQSVADNKGQIESCQRKIKDLGGSVE